MSDPFGLRSLTVEQARARPGAKWQHHAAAYAAWVADMDFPIAPVIRDRLIEVARTDVGYPVWGGKRGVSPARIAFVDRMSSRYRWIPNPAWLYEMSDVVQGVRVAVHHLTDPGDRIVLHTPAYHPFLDTIESMQRGIVRVPSPFDHDTLDSTLAREPARLMILCHPHNPTGHVFTRPELEHLAEIAARHDLVVVSDEIHADLVHDPHGHVPFESLGPEVAGRTITLTSASKAFNLAGLRWAIMHAGSDVMRSALGALPDHYFGAPNVMAVEATATAWTAGDAWLESVRSVLEENRHALSDLLAAHLPSVRYTPPEATYLAWLDCHALGLGDDPAVTFRERGVELSPGPQFGVEGNGFVRLNFATSPAILAETIAAMAGRPH
ncbi:MAG TPA: aminotransferase class I/II-fold pyridoxal phosphate-dependent enzyme [Ilumatobacteraceae bacterium]|nr:aminotransferase class I/II-fold pyridoxal phosphate-dependent enzyme [Ilumatobacteraceae bacterium]